MSAAFKALHGVAMTERDENLDQAQRGEREQAPRKFELPPNCVDVTAEYVGEVIAVIGPARQLKSAASKPRPRRPRCGRHPRR
jgi:hypothetical protein